MVYEYELIDRLENFPTLTTKFCNRLLKLFKIQGQSQTKEKHTHS